MYYRHADLSGTVKSSRDLPWEEIRLLRGAQLFHQSPPEVLEDMKREGMRDADIEKEREGYYIDLFEDSGAYVTEVITTDGTFLLVAQNLDGHGHLYIVKEEKR